MTGDLSLPGSATAFAARIARRYRVPAVLPTVFSARLSGFMALLSARFRHARPWAVVEPHSRAVLAVDLVYPQPVPAVPWDTPDQDPLVAPLHDPAHRAPDRVRDRGPTPHAGSPPIRRHIARARAHEPAIRPFEPMTRPHIGATGTGAPRREGQAGSARDDRVQVPGRTSSFETRGSDREPRQSDLNPRSMVSSDGRQARAGVLADGGQPDGGLRGRSVAAPDHQAASREAFSMPTAADDMVPLVRVAPDRGVGPSRGAVGHAAESALSTTAAPAGLRVGPHVATNVGPYATTNVAGYFPADEHRATDADGHQGTGEQGAGHAARADASPRSGTLDRFPATGPDLQKLADRVYRLIADRLRREQDMRGR